MAESDLWLLLATLTGLSLGGLHLCWGRQIDDSLRAYWGRRCGIASLLCLGCTGLLAASLRSPWLVPMGLLAGVLIVFMLWESPEPRWDRSFLK